MTDSKKTIPLCTIPTTKLTVILNNFIVNTVNHLNKLSLNIDEQLSEFDKKMNDLEVMTKLFESKLDSLPDEIKSTFPELQQCNLDDVNPVFSDNKIPEVEEDKQKEEEIKNEDKNEDNNKEEVKKDEKEGEKEEKKEEEKNKEGELSPEDELNEFLKNNPGYENLYKMLKLGVQTICVKQKAQLNGINMDSLEELIIIAKKINPNII
jgi:hypothetical protein